MQIILDTLGALHIGAPVTSGNLTMIPLQRAAPADGAYQLLDDALEAGLAEITEVSEGGSVPELFFRNRSDRDVLLVDGEELVGAKQNRVLNLSILVGAGAELTIPVSCVEAGRWAWRERRFDSGGRKLHAAARMQKMRGVSASMRESGARAHADVQSDVWRSVAAKMDHFGCASLTSSLHDVYHSLEPRLEAIRTSFSPLPDQVGAVFAIEGRVVGAELFDSATTFARLLPKLADSYAFDALERRPAQDGAAPALDEVRWLLAQIGAARCETYPAVAKGTDVRIDEAGLHAAALLDGGRLVHLSAFAASAGSGKDDPM